MDTGEEVCVGEKKKQMGAKYGDGFLLNQLCHKRKWIEEL